MLHFMFQVRKTTFSCFSPFTIGDCSQVISSGDKYLYLMSHLCSAEPLSKQIAMIAITCHIPVSFLF